MWLEPSPLGGVFVATVNWFIFLADPHCSRMKRACQSVEWPMNAVMNQASHWIGIGAVELHGWLVYTTVLNNLAATDR